MVGIEARVNSAELAETFQQQAGCYQQHQRKGNLTHNKQTANTISGFTHTVAPTFLQLRVEIASGVLNGWSEAHSKPSKQGDKQRKEKYTTVDTHRRRAREVCRTHCQQ